MIIRQFDKQNKTDNLLDRSAKLDACVGLAVPQDGVQDVERLGHGAPVRLVHLRPQLVQGHVVRVVLRLLSQIK